MKKGDTLYQQYVDILKEELRPAMGCTEPIALAYAAARARQVLGAIPDKVRLFVSGNIIKNVKSVVVPNTGGQHGLAAAVCAGIAVGDADKELQVISHVPADAHKRIKDYMELVDLDAETGEYEIGENEEGQKTITLTFTNEDGEGTVTTYTFNSGKDDNGAYIELDGTRYDSVK